MSTHVVDADAQSGERPTPSDGRCRSFPVVLTRTTRYGSRCGPREEWHSCGGHFSDRISANAVNAEVVFLKRRNSPDADTDAT
ncbi:MAG: hypothetical protein ABFS37_01070 [Acidobacteriota bacterium]